MRRLNMREQLVREVEIIPIAVVVRNAAAGSLSERLGIAEGTMLPRSIIEYYLKKDELGDPLVTEEHITAFGWASTQDLDEVVQIALRVNDFLTGLFLGINIRLVDFKLEFGRLYTDDEVRIVVADEISPDNCRLWDARTNEKMDKDRFRQDLGPVEDGYREGDGRDRRFRGLRSDGPRTGHPGSLWMADVAKPWIRAFGGWRVWCAQGIELPVRGFSGPPPDRRPRSRAAAMRAGRYGAVG